MAKANQVSETQPSQVNGEQSAPSIPSKILVLLPTAEEGVYSARIFDSKTAVKKAINLKSLPAGVIFMKARPLEPKVETVVKL